jgi:hypothetical protein
MIDGAAHAKYAVEGGEEDDADSDGLPQGCVLPLFFHYWYHLQKRIEFVLYGVGGSDAV